MATTRRIVADDNLGALAQVGARSVQLAYLDPPFNSGRAYGAYLGRSRMSSAETARAFGDSWEWSSEIEHLVQQLDDWVSRRTAETVRAVLRALGRTSTAAYVAMMTPRLAEVHRVLTEEGSVYVHVDPSAEHYIRLLLDLLFGEANFRNQIVWRRTHAHSSSRRFGPVHDSLLFYSKSSAYTWNQPTAPYRDDYLQKYYRGSDERGQFQLITCTAPGDRVGTLAHYEWQRRFPPPGRHWAWKRERMEEFQRDGRLMYSSTGVPRLKRYADEGRGVAVQDVWIDINRLDAHSDERTGYETQKPIALLDRIVRASSNPGDTILDPFGGTGTTAISAEMTGRGWVTIDASLLASSITLGRLRQVARERQIELVGFPGSGSEAKQLLRRDPLAFGAWATGMLSTAINRETTSRSVACGTGRVFHKHRDTDVVSWVPMRSDYRVSIPRGRPARLNKLLLYVADAANPDRLLSFISDHYARTPHPVRLDDLVSSRAHRAGIAPSVLTLASSP